MAAMVYIPFMKKKKRPYISFESELLDFQVITLRADPLGRYQVGSYTHSYYFLKDRPQLGP